MFEHNDIFTSSTMVIRFQHSNNNEQLMFGKITVGIYQQWHISTVRGGITQFFTLLLIILSTRVSIFKHFSSNIMPPTVTNAFKTWLKENVNMKLSSDAAVTRVTYEGITNFESLTDFDKTSIEYLPRTYKEKILAITEDIPVGIQAESKVPGANVGTISV